MPKQRKRGFVEEDVAPTGSSKLTKGKGKATNKKSASGTKSKSKTAGKPKSLRHVILKFKPGELYQNKQDFTLKGLLKDQAWKSIIEDLFQENYVKQLEDLLGQDYSDGIEIFPPQELIFNAFHLTPLSKVKIVILGQDPYHGDGQAHGLSFSVQKGVDVPPSLRNIYKELENDIPEFSRPNHGCLEKWAEEGVFLLNAFLTVEAHFPASHSKYGWKQFTDGVIRAISDHCTGVVFILWGQFAQSKASFIDDIKHGIIETSHPSPMSGIAFTGCKCFSRANELLISYGKTPVDWKLK